VRALADDLCGGRSVFVLEGGYAASSLRDGTRAVLRSLLEPSPALPAALEAALGSTLRRVVDRVAGVHRRRYPDLGAA
jgi:acetoin utilization deacetylase AcuC-like enzyme